MMPGPRARARDNRSNDVEMMFLFMIFHNQYIWFSGVCFDWFSVACAIKYNLIGRIFRLYIYIWKPDPYLNPAFV